MGAGEADGTVLRSKRFSSHIANNSAIDTKKHRDLSDGTGRYIYGMRSGDITDAFLASDLLSWKNEPANIEPDMANVTVQYPCSTFALRILKTASAVPLQRPRGMA
jgi:hypothetical protein